MNAILLNAFAHRRHRVALGLSSVVALALCSLLLSVFDAKWVMAQEEPAQLQSAAANGDYVLGPLDKIRLKVFAWRPSRDEVYEWKALNDVYTVGASGEVSLPLIGDVGAGGSNVRELSNAVSNRMKEALGLVDAPFASIEIVQFRPFYILGAVERPGEYAFRPHLTIVQALSIAGGMPRFNEFEAIRLDRDSISTIGERHVIESEIKSLLAKRARLEAEAKGASAITFPWALTQLDDTATIAPLMQEEKNIFNARRSAFELRMAELQHMKDVLQKDLQTSQANLESHNSYVQLAKQEFDQFEQLYAKKLTTTNRRAEAARNLMQIESERLRMESDQTRIRQDISRNGMETLDMQTARINQAVADLRTAQSRLDELKGKLATAERLLHGSSSTSPRLVSTQDDAPRNAINYKIIRIEGGQPIELAASETTLLQPGDTIKVSIEQRAGGYGTIAQSGDRLTSEIDVAPTNFIISHEASVASETPQ